MIRKAGSNALSVATFAAFLYCLWMEVQFLRGEVSSWPITALNGYLPTNAQLSGSLDVAFKSNGGGIGAFIGYYIAGLVGYVALAGFIALIGSAAARIVLVGWTQYQAEQLAAKKVEQERNQFKSVGELVTIRTIVAHGLLSAERFTEVETTEGVFVVEGEVGTVSKGLAVSKKGYDEVRIGGLHSRTYPLRSV